MNINKFTWLASDATKMHGIHWFAEGDTKASLCLVHGLGEHSGRYSNMANYFTTLGYDVFSFDLRGHGLSEGQRGYTPSIERMLEDIDTFIGQLRNEQENRPLFLLGHSMGGMLAANYSLTFDVELAGVIVSSAMFLPAFEPPWWKIKLARLLHEIYPRLSLSNEIDDSLLTRDRTSLQQRRKDVLIHDQISVSLGAQLLERGQALLDNTTVVNFPMLVMHGDADKITSYKASAQFANKIGANGILKIWNGFYHELYQEPEREEVFSFLGNWMGKRLSKIR